ncbi:MAG: CPBP family intramembrane metalloprotease [Planctomycetes bacterium]|nr:CPBP family intramembrane metalloprotease [Planctomycetota bacterium]
MDTGNTEITTHQDTAIQQLQHCSYCGASLNFSFYFCVSCATPYKSIANVVSPYIPPQLTESELIRTKAPNVWRVFWTYAIVLFFVLIFAVSMGFDSTARNYTLLMATACMIVTTVVVGIIYWPSLAVQLKRFGFFQKYAWYGLGILIGMLLLNYMYSSFLMYLGPNLPSFNDLFSKMELGPFGKLFIICIVPGITEEIAFRGLIQHWLQIAIKPWRAIILASALFAAMHLSVLHAPYIFLLGLLLGWMKWKTGSLYPSMLVHILHNYVVIAIFPLLRM